MGARFLDDEAHAAFQRAVTTIEQASAVEVVIAIRRRSASYLHVNLIVGAIVAFGCLAAMMFVDYAFSNTAIVFDPFVAGIVAGLLVQVTPGVQRVLTPAAVRRRYVERAARATFVERGVDVTTGRTGILVYIAWLEQRVVLVADRGLADLAEALTRAEAALTSAMTTGGAEVARILESIAPVLAAALPHAVDDVNELPDAIDSDLEGRP
jgi:putative membrane protein